MKMIIETVEHSSQDYETIGNYKYLEDGTVHITISNMGNEVYESLVALHEFVEERLTKWRGIKEGDITKFDIDFESKREEGNNDEPGFSKDAPYRHEHLAATGIEMIMASLAGIEWSDYEQKIYSL